MSCQLIPLSHVDLIIAYAAMTAAAPRDLSAIRLTVPGDCTNDGKPLALDFGDAATRDDIGRLIYGANAAALESLYEERHGLAATARALAESYAFKPSTGPMEPARIIGACDYVDYQCDSPDSYIMSLPQWIVAAIREKAARELGDGWRFEDEARESDMPEIDEPDPAESSAPRAALLARLSADPAAPAPEPGPKPEPETAAKAAQKGRQSAKAKTGRKAPAKGAKRSKGRKTGATAPKSKGGATASPPATASKRKVAAPLVA